MWKGTGFLLKKENNCISIKFWQLCEKWKDWYVTNMGNVHTFNLLVGRNILIFRKKKHLLGGLAVPRIYHLLTVHQQYINYLIL